MSDDFCKLNITLFFFVCFFFTFISFSSKNQIFIFKYFFLLSIFFLSVSNQKSSVSTFGPLLACGAGPRWGSVRMLRMGATDSVHSLTVETWIITTRTLKQQLFKWSLQTKWPRWRHFHPLHVIKNKQYEKAASSFNHLTVIFITRYWMWHFARTAQ